MIKVVEVSMIFLKIFLLLKFWKPIRNSSHFLNLCLPIQQLFSAHYCTIVQSGLIQVFVIRHCNFMSVLPSEADQNLNILYDHIDDVCWYRENHFVGPVRFLEHEYPYVNLIDLATISVSIKRYIRHGKFR